jgi:prepilin-type N-terminal cleavage/methylation domain-containing protein
MSPTGPYRPNKTGGFTLLELIMVIVIIGLFSAVLTSRSELFMDHGDLRAASRIIINEIKALRAEAAHTHEPVELGIDMDKNLLYTVKDVSGGEEAGSWQAVKERTRRHLRDLPQEVSVTDVVVMSRGRQNEGEVLIRFLANGCVERSLIHLRNEENDIYTLEILPLTGQVRLYDRYVDKAWTE